MAKFVSAPYNIAERTQAALAQSGLTKAALARLTGMTYNQVSEVLRGNRPAVSADTVRRLALALGCTTDYLLGMDAHCVARASQDADASQRSAAARIRLKGSHYANPPTLA